jgi:starvation-inducible DNA-binding protein
MASYEGKFTVPGLSLEEGHKLASALQGRLNALNDLQLTLKHAHWNVVGRDFIAVHEMLDPQIDAVREHVDTTAERMATMGVSPQGTPGAIVKERSWDDYSLGRASCEEHLAALDIVYAGVISDHRKAMKLAAEIDPITEDMLIGQVKDLELFHWFVRAHLENSGGDLDTRGAKTEQQAAAAAVASSRATDATR